MSSARGIRRWAELLTTAGFAALIASIGGNLSEFSRGAQANRQGRCELATRIVEDDTLNTALDADKRRRMSYMAASALERCFKD